jgi:hypothetical protein
MAQTRRKTESKTGSKTGDSSLSAALEPRVSRTNLSARTRNAAQLYRAVEQTDLSLGYSKRVIDKNEQYAAADRAWTDENRSRQSAYDKVTGS